MTAAHGRYVFASVLGFGDALISLALLRRVRERLAPLELVGSPVTRQVLELIDWPELQFTEVLPAHAAYFRARTAPLREILGDLQRFQRWARQNLTVSDTVIFEKSDWRNRLALGLSRAAVRAPLRRDSIYVDRAALLGELAGESLALEPCRRPGKIARVLINPAARHAFKELALPVARKLCLALRRQGLATSVLDPDGRYASLRADVDEYFGKMELGAAVALLRQHDLYVGPDSFFVHLAYFCSLPYFITGPAIDAYFLPPGTRDTGNWAQLDSGLDEAAWRPRLERFLVGT